VVTWSKQALSAGYQLSVGFSAEKIKRKKMEAVVG
jgi:hypothetical protein